MHPLAADFAHQLQVQEQAVASTTQPKDNVVKQSPAANTPSNRGTRISPVSTSTRASANWAPNA